jgi:hypothetical protein
MTDEEIAVLERQAIQAEAVAAEDKGRVHATLHAVAPWMTAGTPSLPPEIGNLIPPTGYVREYMDWSYPMTDAPAEYHVAAAMSALSIAIGNQAYIESGPLRLYANIWVVIIGGSSYFRKTTALNFNRKIISTVVPERILGEDMTPQSLAKKFSEEPNRILMPSEFGDLIESMQIEFNRGLKQKFTSLFDVPEDFSKERSTEGNSYSVRFPFLTIMSATAAEWLKLTEKDLRGGFYARFIFMNAKTKRGRFIARQPAPDGVLQAKLCAHLKGISRAGTGIVVDTTQVDARYEDWQRHHVTQCDDFQRPDLLSSFWTRLESYCWKFAVLYRVSRLAKVDSPNRLCLLPEDLEYAIRLTEFHKGQIIDLLSNVFTFNRSGEVRQKILRMIEQKPGMTMRDINTWGHFDKRDGAEGEMKLLLSAGTIRTTSEKAGNGKNTQRFWLKDDPRCGATAMQL